MKPLAVKKTVRCDGSTLEYIVSGSGALIVLVNGSGGPIEGWFRVFPELTKLDTVFAYNRLGIGKSDKPKEPQTSVDLITHMN
jgi:pimeloyl-ACP methyl ester carboxylesterase